MAVLSVLCRTFSRSFGGVLTKSAVVPSVKPTFLTPKDGIRHMSGGHHKRIFVVTASRFQWKKFKDIFHFYIMLGAIPLGLIILYANIFIGQAELREIPEGYVPQPHEYYQHPIKRWFAKYIYVTDQEFLERALHYMTEEEELRQIKLLEKEVRRVMVKHDDYKAWYYKPVTGKYHRLAREEWDRIEEEVRTP